MNSSSRPLQEYLVPSPSRTSRRARVVGKCQKTSTRIIRSMVHHFRSNNTLRCADPSPGMVHGILPVGASMDRDRRHVVVRQCGRPGQPNNLFARFLIRGIYRPSRVEGGRDPGARLHTGHYVAAALSSSSSSFVRPASSRTLPTRTISTTNHLRHCTRLHTCTHSHTLPLQQSGDEDPSLALSLDNVDDEKTNRGKGPRQLIVAAAVGGVTRKQQAPLDAEATRCGPVDGSTGDGFFVCGTRHHLSFRFHVIFEMVSTTRFLVTFFAFAIAVLLLFLFGCPPPPLSHRSITIHPTTATLKTIKTLVTAITPTQY
jgi:hypothetical protein